MLEVLYECCPSSVDLCLFVVSIQMLQVDLWFFFFVASIQMLQVAIKWPTAP